MRDVKHLGTGRAVPTLKSQVLLTVCAFGAGVLVNQHFTDAEIDRARSQARRAAVIFEHCPPLLTQLDAPTEEPQQ